MWAVGGNISSRCWSSERRTWKEHEKPWTWISKYGLYCFCLAVFVIIYISNKMVSESHSVLVFKSRLNLAFSHWLDHCHCLWGTLELFVLLLLLLFSINYGVIDDACCQLHQSSYFFSIAYLAGSWHSCLYNNYSASNQIFVKFFNCQMFDMMQRPSPATLSWWWWWWQSIYFPFVTNMSCCCISGATEGSGFAAAAWDGDEQTSARAWTRCWSTHMWIEELRATVRAAAATKGIFSLR